MSSAIIYGMADTEPTAAAAGDTTGESGEGRWSDRVQTVITFVVVILCALVTAYQSWRMREVYTEPTHIAVLFTLQFVLAPPLLAYRAAHSPKGGTRTVLLLVVLVVALLYASLLAQYLTEQGSAHPWPAAAGLTFLAGSGTLLLLLRGRP
jgi:cation transport ATPase